MFKSARLKLTLWYILIIMLISVSFSVVIYRNLTDEVDRFARIQRSRIERRLFVALPPAPITDESELVAETKQHFLLELILVNGAILLVAGGSAYFLAGRTLKPIKLMVDEQGRFISDASHELRTPLTSLKSAFEVYLRDDKATLSQAKNLVKESIEEVDKMESLSTALLQLAKFEKPNGKKTFELVSLKKTIAEAVKKTRSSVIVQGRDYKILGDTDALTNLWIILLDNANKYSNSKSKIVVRTDKSDAGVRVKVEDFGMGISKDDLPHIFDRFYRANNARSKNGIGGYGLGLAIARKIVEEHNGRIFATSIVGKGTTITVEI